MGIPLYLVYAVAGIILSSVFAVMLQEWAVRIIMLVITGVSVWFAWFVIKNHADWSLLRTKRYSRYELDAPHFFRIKQ